MTPLRALCLAFIASLPAWMAAGCAAPEAVGVDACRAIEAARCSAAAACGPDSPIHVDDVAACQRFYESQCLHGLGVSKAPSRPKLRACVQTLEAAGRCVRAAAGAEDVALGDCPAFEPSLGRTRLVTACAVIAQPEQVEPCAFLTSDGMDPLPDAGTGGGAGASGSAGAGGASGSAGASDAGGAAGASGSAGAG